MRGTLAAAMIALACGCTGWEPTLIALLEPEELAQQETSMLVLTCQSREHVTSAVVAELIHRRDVSPRDAYGCPELTDEFVRRGVFRQRHAARIKAGKVVTGMSTAELRGARGAPRDRTVSRSGTHTRHVYGDFGPYIYTRDGVVTSWQED